MRSRAVALCAVLCALQALSLVLADYSAYAGAEDFSPYIRYRKDGNYEFQPFIRYRKRMPASKRTVVNPIMAQYNDLMKQMNEPANAKKFLPHKRSAEGIILTCNDPLQCRQMRMRQTMAGNHRV